MDLFIVVNAPDSRLSQYYLLSKLCKKCSYFCCSKSLLGSMRNIVVGTACRSHSIGTELNFTGDMHSQRLQRIMFLTRRVSHIQNSILFQNHFLIILVIIYHLRKFVKKNCFFIDSQAIVTGLAVIFCKPAVLLARCLLFRLCPHQTNSERLTVR